MEKQKVSYYELEGTYREIGRQIAGQELKEETPLNMLGMPDDIAETAVFLCSDRARFITGQIVGVNGGMII